MIRIEDIVQKVANTHPQADLDLLRRAYLFSAREHKGQKRASGESYLVHPLEVADILADMKLDEVSVATGLLHDVVEDTLVDLETIREYFGDKIAHLVDGLTKIAHISNISREEQQGENVRKMLLAMVDDVRVVWTTTYRPRVAVCSSARPVGRHTAAGHGGRSQPVLFARW